MTEEELRGLTTEDFNVLSDRVSSEASRRKALDSLRSSVNASVKEYKGWGGSPSDLLDLLSEENIPEFDGVRDPPVAKSEEAVDPVVEVEPETPADTNTEGQQEGLTW